MDGMKRIIHRDTAPSRGRQILPEELLGPLNEIERKFAPPKLYVRGPMEIPLPHPRVAIVGTRQPSDRGLEVASKLAAFLVKEKAVVVSGLAKGVDTAAHVAALDCRGETLAVLGTPLSKAYPAENADLQARIGSRCLLVSQFSEGHSTLPKDFVLRNRTMALIADASVIVESGEGGGSLHQGWEALRLGRPLFIHSGEFSKPGITWPRKMQEFGAIEFTDPEEIMNLIPSAGLGVAAAALL